MKLSHHRNYWYFSVRYFILLVELVSYQCDYAKMTNTTYNASMWKKKSLSLPCQTWTVHDDEN